jgi:hypothetical protein
MNSSLSLTDIPGRITIRTASSLYSGENSGTATAGGGRPSCRGECDENDEKQGGLFTGQLIEVQADDRGNGLCEGVEGSSVVDVHDSPGLEVGDCSFDSAANLSCRYRCCPRFVLRWPEALASPCWRPGSCAL